jgi:hypothetical protein
MFYKFGGKQLYYFNTYDGSGEIDVDKMNTAQPLMESVSPVLDEEACDSCAI